MIKGYVFEKQVTGIIYCSTPQPVTGNRFLKYRNISNNPTALRKFALFASKFNGAEHINFYGKLTKKFIRQIKLPIT